MSKMTQAFRDVVSSDCLSIDVTAELTHFKLVCSY